MNHIILIFLFYFIFHLALSKVPFWLVAVFPYGASYATSLFRSQAGHIFAGEKETRPQHRELHVLLFTNNVPVPFKTSHSYLRTRVVRRDLHFIVLIRENLKVCWCNYKGSTLKTLNDGSAGVELTTYRTTLEPLGLHKCQLWILLGSQHV